MNLYRCDFSIRIASDNATDVYITVLTDEIFVQVSARCPVLAWLVDAALDFELLTIQVTL